jgi:putative endopeptidase
MVHRMLPPVVELPAAMIRSALVAVLAALPGVVLAAPALDLTQLSKTTLACTDFDEYVNGVWRAATPIPADRSRIGSFEGLRDESRRVVEQALADAMRDAAPLDTRGKQLAANYYASGLDQASIDRRGVSALQPLFAQIDKLNDRSRLPALLALLARHRIAAPLSVYVQPDPKDKRRYILHFDQSGLGLPDRDDYFRDDERTLTVRRAYDAYRERLAHSLEGQGTCARIRRGLCIRDRSCTVIDDPSRAARSERHLSPAHGGLVVEAGAGAGLG